MESTNIEQQVNYHKLIESDIGNDNCENQTRFKKKYKFIAFILTWALLIGCYFMYQSSSNETNINPSINPSNNPDKIIPHPVSFYILEFDKFMKKYNKSYSTREEQERRFQIFIDNFIAIEEHNNTPDITYTKGINQFADLTPEEFANMNFGLIVKPDQITVSLLRSSVNNEKDIHQMNDLSNLRVEYIWNNSVALPESVDWRSSKCITPVENQGKCGSCWAFSAVGATETAYCLKHGNLLRLSEQQLVDCAKKEGNSGCKGGDMDRAFVYMINEKGLCKEDDYPYRAKTKHCKANRCRAQVQVTRYVDIPRDNERALMSALAEHGPIAVGVESDKWQLYHSGIFTAPCGEKLDHGVLLVGYGTENNIPYWIIKNSWGPLWGEDGFIRLTRQSTNPAGECGILLDASFPIVA